MMTKVNVLGESEKLSPARSWFCHGNCTNAFSSNHLRDEFLDLGIAAIMADVGHHNVRVERESRP